MARAAGARAALRVHAPQMRIELWVAPRAPGQPESVEWLSSEGEDERVLALRAIEALRARALVKMDAGVGEDERRTCG